MMMPFLPLSPRYRLDDELPWLEGIDPSRHYWISVNGDATLKVAIPGLVIFSLAQFKDTILSFRALKPGEHLVLNRTAEACTIYCISQNCYAIAAEVLGAPVWHLFDQETLESLLMTGHPDWQCSPKDVDLGRKMLMRSWQQSVAA
ncbi:hypothetical protein [Leptothermofonsia sp. ETS-13]|uniref:hypothetical protein n=1 Tax=Leptothermofonsia sp. ETS-13 TaxID=3035696 RepID=UPI003BA34837